MKRLVLLFIAILLVSCDIIESTPKHESMIITSVIYYQNVEWLEFRFELENKITTDSVAYTYPDRYTDFHIIQFSSLIDYSYDNTSVPWYGWNEPNYIKLCGIMLDPAIDTEITFDTSLKYNVMQNGSPFPGGWKFGTGSITTKSIPIEYKESYNSE